MKKKDKCVNYVEIGGFVNMSTAKTASASRQGKARMLYNINIDPRIDICLNCTRKRCYGTCELMKMPTKEYVIRKRWKTADKKQKTSYINDFDSACITVSNIEKAKKYTYMQALNIMANIKHKTGVVIEILKFKDVKGVKV